MSTRDDTATTAVGSKSAPASPGRLLSEKIVSQPSHSQHPPLSSPYMVSSPSSPSAASDLGAHPTSQRSRYASVAAPSSTSSSAVGSKRNSSGAIGQPRASFDATVTMPSTTSSATSSAAASPSILGPLEKQTAPNSSAARDVWRHSLPSGGPNQISPYGGFQLADQSHPPPGLVSYGETWLGQRENSNSPEWGPSEAVLEDVELIDAWFRTLHRKEQVLTLYNLLQHVQSSEALENVIGALQQTVQKPALSALPLSSEIKGLSSMTAMSGTDRLRSLLPAIRSPPSGTTSSKRFHLMKKEPLPLFTSSGAAAAAAAANTMTSLPTASTSSEQRAMSLNPYGSAAYSGGMPHGFYDDPHLFKAPMLVQQQSQQQQARSFAQHPGLSRRASVDFLRPETEEPFLGQEMDAVVPRAAVDDTTVGHRRMSRAGAPGDHRDVVPTSPHAVSPTAPLSQGPVGDHSPSSSQAPDAITQNWAFSRRGSTTSETSHVHQKAAMSPSSSASPKTVANAGSPKSGHLWSKASPNASPSGQVTSASSSPAPPPGITSLPHPVMSTSSSRRTSVQPKSVGFAAIGDESGQPRPPPTMAAIVAGHAAKTSSHSSSSSSPVEQYASPPPMSAAVRAMQPLYSQHFNQRRSRSISGQGAFTEQDFIRRPSLPIGLMTAVPSTGSGSGGDDSGDDAGQNTQYNHFPSLSSSLSGQRHPPPSNGPSNHHGLTANEQRVDFALLEDIPAWLRSLRLHKYTTTFEHMKWRAMVKLNDQQLDQLGVAALGARRKMLKMFQNIMEEAEKQGIRV